MTEKTTIVLPPNDALVLLGFLSRFSDAEELCIRDQPEE